jgi:phosphoribosylglycinamide formyltransferase 1
VPTACTENYLKDAIVEMDKKALPRAIKLFLEDKLIIEKEKVIIKKGFEDELFV